MLKLNGHSGCNIEIVFYPQPSVRKTAPDPKYAKRLDRQRRKQQAFRSPVQDIHVPRILTYNETSFTMEYLSMFDSIEFLERANPEMIRERMQVLIKFLQWEFTSIIPTAISKNVFLEKLSNIRQAVPQSIWGQYYACHADELIKALPENLTIPMGNCHGDLTLSNVMFSMEKNCIGLIDFLDSFVNTPLVDLVKIRQDTSFHWTSYNYPKNHDRGKIYLIDMWIDKTICEVFGAMINTLEYWAFESINFLRIAPYVESEIDHRYLSQTLNQIHNA